MATDRGKQTVRRIAGLLFWAATITLGIRTWMTHDDEGALARRVATHLVSEPPTFDADFPAATPLGEGNAVKIETKKGLLVAGRVKSVRRDGSVKHAVIAIYPEWSDRVNADTRLYSARTSGDVSWIIKTLLPPERVDAMKALVLPRWEAERGRFFRELEPGLVRFGEDALDVLRADFAKIVETHRAEIATIGTVIREKAWTGNFDVVFKDEVWPVVEDRSMPILKSIGDEIVREVPVWALSWSYIVQTLPFTDNDRVAARVRDFIKDQAMPIVKGYGPEFRDMAAAVFRETLENDRTIEALEAAAEQVGNDPRFREAATKIFRAWVIENERFRGLVATLPDRPDVIGPVNRLLSRLEPDVKKLANMIVLDETKKGINPDLARVLRRKILRENESWVLLELNDDPGGGAPTRLVGLDGGIR